MDVTTFLNEKYLRLAFNLLDQDNNGKIDSSDLKQLLAGKDFKEEQMGQIDQLIAEADENGDGEVDFDEFITVMRSISE